MYLSLIRSAPFPLEVERVGCREQTEPGADLRRRRAAHDVERAFVGLQIVLPVIGFQLVAIHEAFKVNVTPRIRPMGVPVVVDLVRLDDRLGGLDLGSRPEDKIISPC